MRPLRSLSLLFVCGLLAAQKAPMPINPTGSISLMPHRVVMEGRTRTAEVLVKNSGVEKVSFRVSMVEKGMKEDGTLEDRIKGADETTASDLVRFTPRQVDLEPGGSQVIRFQLRKPDALPDGEYRSHLLVQGIPPSTEAPPLTGEGADKGISFAITQIMGISVPVIVRQGTPTAEIRLTGARYFQPEGAGLNPVVSVFLERSGGRSVIGEITLTLESGGVLPAGTVLWRAKSVGIYTNLTRRQVFLGVPDGASGKLKGAKAKITFQATDMKLAPVTTLVDLTF